LADVLAGRAKLVLFVGNLVPVKGPDVFLKSISLLRPTAYSLQPTVSLIIGDGPMRRGLEREARRLGLGESVFFLGSRPHAEVARWMNVADVLCLTSRSEGMPNAVIEALVSGLPVVVTDVGACRELVEDEPLARWCLAEDTQAVARAIRDVLGLAADRPAMAARHGARFSWARQARRILELMGLGKNG
jgi:glycosyltransferase involved in cell wall biosynthesis